MYTREKPYEVEKYSSRNMPSFSTAILDEIYRSIEENADGTETFWAYKEKPAKRRGTIGKNPTKDEEIESFRRFYYVVQKLMENEATSDKIVSKRSSSLLQDNDDLFFSSTSSSSDSSGQLSSSDNVSCGSNKKTQVLCSSYTWPKPINTVFVPRENERKRDGNNHDEKFKMGDDMIKSKSRALKIYANLKKVKHPISPGGRLTSLINSLFSCANGKKSQMKSSKFLASLASSFSRSCLSKCSPESREKMRNEIKRAALSALLFMKIQVLVGINSYTMRIPTSLEHVQFQRRIEQIRRMHRMV